MSEKFFVEALEEPERGILEVDGSSQGSTSTRWTKQQALTAAALSLMNFTTQVSFSLIAPFYAVEAEGKGVTSTEVGMVFGVFQLVIFLTSPFYGKFINAIGAKEMFIGGSLMCGLANIAFGFVDEINDTTVYLAMCFVCRLFEANGASMLVTASFAIMANQFNDNVGSALGMLKTFSGVGMAIGPSIGGGLYALGGFKIPFISVGGLVVVAAVLSIFILPKIADATVITGSFIPFLKSAGCLVVYGIIIGNTIALSSMDPVFSPFLDEKFHLTAGQIGLMFMIAPGIFGILAPLIGCISDKGWHGTLVVAGSLINGVSFLLLGPSPIFRNLIQLSIGETITALVLMGISVGFVLIPVFPMLIRLARSLGFEESLHTCGLISGFVNSSSAFGAFIGPCLSGYLAEALNFEWAMTVSGFIIIGLGLLLVIYIQIMRYLRSWPPRDMTRSRSSGSYVEGQETDPLLAT